MKPSESDFPIRSEPDIWTMLAVVLESERDANKSIENLKDRSWRREGSIIMGSPN